MTRFLVTNVKGSLEEDVTLETLEQFLEYVKDTFHPVIITPPSAPTRFYCREHWALEIYDDYRE